MTPLAKLPGEGAAVSACAAAQLVVTLDAADRIASVVSGPAATAGRVSAAQGLNGSGAGLAAVTVPANLSLKQAVALRHTQSCPLLVVDAQGAMLGSVSETEIFPALLRA